MARRKAGRQWSKITNLGENYFQLSVLYPAKLSIKEKVKIKVSLDVKSLKTFLSSKFREGVLQREKTQNLANRIPQRKEAKAY